MCRRWLVAGVLLGGCSDRPVVDPSNPGSSESTAAVPTTETPTPTTAGTSDAVEVTGDVIETTSAESSGTESVGVSESSSGTEPSATTGEPVTCGPPCAEGWAIDGDLTLSAGGDADAFACLTRVGGTLTIPGGIDAAGLAGLRNVREVGLLVIEFNNSLTDLSPFECLEVAHDGLSIYQAEALVDTSALAGLRVAPYVSLTQTGLTALPTFSPAYEGLGNLYLATNSALVDLDVVAGWPLVSAGSVYIQLDDNASLTSVAGISGLIAASDYTFLQITRSPALQSLAGLEPLKGSTLWLEKLPLVPDLEPLANVVETNGITLLGMPKVESLHGLHNVKRTSEFVIGNCIEPEMAGMDGLKDLSGLDALERVDYLSIANNANLTGLGGAPLLASLNTLSVLGNPMLTQADVDALVGQLDFTPEQCFGGWNECSCFQLMPW